MPWWIRLPLLFFAIWGLMEHFMAEEGKLAILEHTTAQFFMVLVLLILIAMELILGSIENVMFHTLSEAGKERYLAQKNKKMEWTWAKEFLAKITKSRSLEQEGEIILDHDYDGIKELDNVLPPWWVYLFYGSIIFAVVYMLRFHVFGDYNQVEEYERKMTEAQLAVAEYKRTAKDLVDASTVEFLSEASDLAAGKAVYTANCVICHMADGGGGIGPNLTDAYWILGGDIKDIFNTVSEGGRDGKGMVPWKQSLKPREIAQVSSYIMTMAGTVPANPKAPEGELYQAADGADSPVEE